MTLYRVVYKNGSHGAWTSNYNRIKEFADRFNLEIEIWERD